MDALHHDELHIEVYHKRAQGMHTNGWEKVLVKVTHVPTGLVTYCDTERAQHANREKAIAELTKLVNDKCVVEDEENKG